MFVCMFDIYVVIKENHLDLHWTLSHMFIHSKNLVYLWEGVCNKAIPSQKEMTFLETANSKPNSKQQTAAASIFAHYLQSIGLYRVLHRTPAQLDMWIASAGSWVLRHVSRACDWLHWLHTGRTLFIQFMHQDTFSLTLHIQKLMLFNGLLIISNR